MFSPRTHLTLGFSVGILILLLNTTLPVVHRNWLVRSQERVEALETQAGDLKQLLSALKDAETGVRGFLLNGQESFLLPYVQGVETGNRQLARLGPVLNVDREQAARLQRVKSLTDSLRRFHEQTIKTRRSQGAAAVTQVDLGHGKLIMDRLRIAVSDMIAAQDLRASALHIQIKTREEWISTLIVAIMLLDAFVFSLIYWITQRFLRQRLQVEERLRTVGETLEETNRRQERHNRDISLMSRMASALQSAKDGEEFFGIVGKFARQLFLEHPGAIYVYRPSRDLIERMTDWHDPARCEGLFEPDHCWAVRRGQPHRVVSPADDLVCKHVHAGTGGYLCLPLVAHGEPVGLLHLEAGGRPIDDDAERMALAMSEQVALAMSNMNLRETLRRQSIVDPLSGLYNRRFLDETLRRELARAQRAGTPLSVAMIDIDHFKQYNDSHGHEAGDQVIRALAQELGRQMRGSDLACRYGGEEFTLIFVDAGAEDTARRMDQIRRAVMELTVRHAGATLEHITISAGVAGYPAHGLEPDALLQAADRALYQAKHQGRNRVELHRPDRG